MIFGLQPIDHWYYPSKYIEEERDDHFLDWISQGGGTDEPFIDSHCHLDFLLDRYADREGGEGGLHW